VDAVCDGVVNTTTVEYDCKEFHREPEDRKARTKSEILARAFEKQLGVCAGYAILFEAMCQAAGIQAKVINGYGRNTPRPPNPERLPNSHAWNAVEIDGQWHLLDATWAAGSVSGDCDQFVPSFNDVFFLTPPAVFFRQHWPEDPQWQLLPEAQTAENFAALPHFYRLPASLQLGEYGPAAGILDGESEAFDFRLAISGAEKAFVVMGERRLEMTKGPDEVFQYTLPRSAVRGRTVKLVALQDSRLHGVVDYRLQ
jgi:hypothetical protein